MARKQAGVWRQIYDVTSERRWRQPLGRWISIAIVVAAVILGLTVLYRANYYPRTEDAEIFANFIGIAPQVDGPLIRLNVKDNQFVKKGELLYEIDDRPYQYALENALSEQSSSGRANRRRATKNSSIGERSFCRASEHPQLGSRRDKRGAGRQTGRAPNGITRTTICIALSHCLAKQFVTVDQVDKAKSFGNSTSRSSEAG